MDEFTVFEFPEEVVFSLIAQAEKSDDRSAYVYKGVVRPFEVTIGESVLVRSENVVRIARLISAVEVHSQGYHSAEDLRKKGDKIFKKAKKDVLENMEEFGYAADMASIDETGAPNILFLGFKMGG